MSEIIYKKESYAIIGACFEVYNDKGCGFLELVYQECLGIEFEYQRIPTVATPPLNLRYRGRLLLQTYQPDYVCFEKIILEIKTVCRLTDEHRAQILNYLNATGFELGLLVKFGHYPKLAMNALRRLGAFNPKRIFPMSAFSLFASIRMIRGLVIQQVIALRSDQRLVKS